MPNKFSSNCYRCGEPVAPGAGVFEKTSQRIHGKKWPGERIPKWLTQHHECAQIYRGTNKHYLFAPTVQPPTTLEERESE